MFGFNSKQELIDHAKKEADKVEKKYQHTIYLYFIARYFVLVYEAKYGKLPIQVWNEYRNAFDHFARYLTSNDDAQISKIEGHIQRAALDMMKLLSHHTQDKFVDIYQSYKPDIVSMVDNGKFSEEIEERRQKSEKLFVNAKIHDSNLGSDIDGNEKVLNNYLDAAFSTISNLDYIASKSNDLNNAQIKYNAIHSEGSREGAKGSFWEDMKVHAVFYAFLIGGSILLGAVGSSYFGTPDVKKSVTKGVEKFISMDNNVSK